MKFNILLLAFLCCAVDLVAGSEKDTVIVRPKLSAKRIDVTPKIDGLLDEDFWKSAEVAGNFIQYSPKEKAPVSFPTEVKIVYDNTAIYIGAMCYDNSPDSIKRQLGLRDDYINADNFLVRFDTYNTQIDAFTFAVSASGVQSDSRLSDMNFNAVWHSNVKILSNGWSVEMEIPWSALRFPNSKEQTWGIQLARNIQRKFEYDQWAQTPKTSPNPLKYWGILSGLDNIESPFRLSLTPYLTGIVEQDSRFGPDKPSASVGGGMGLKYGINESFTLDMTLLPDFSQVKSDDIVKNLKTFEIQFAERRPFFTEGTDLFERGGIFYSRRIGKTPTKFYAAPYLVDTNEKIIKNPSLSKLLNATKVTGRTTNGLGIGVLNAFVDNTYAIAQDTITGATRKILTEPSSNYNIFVFDKQLANSSNMYVTNTNVVRSNGYRSANVTATGFSLNNKKNTWNFNGDGGVSNVLEPTYVKGQFESNIGYYYQLAVSKNSGKLRYGARRQEVNRNWDCNDMGINLQTNYSSNSADITYNVFNPWKIINNAFFNLYANYTDNLETRKMNAFSIGSFSNITFRNFWSTYIGFDLTPLPSHDFYEPRSPGRFYEHPAYYYFFGGFNSNDNKAVSFGVSYSGGFTEKISEVIPSNPWGGGGLNLNWRAGNRFSLNLSSNYFGDFGDRGWVDEEWDGTIVFGERVLNTYENGLYANFVFMRDMTLSFSGRYLWATGHYRDYFVLGDDGILVRYINYPGVNDFSFTSFNIDMVYNWIFAPGSTLSIAWKQNILSEETVIDYNYSHNFKNTIHGPALNQLSVRVLYFLDYIYIKNALDKRKKTS